LDALRAQLSAGLAARSLRYRGSDGTERTLTLAELAARAEAMEMAYNPNDCIEIRWGATEGSPEMAACRRRAPASQRRMMGQYRNWFSTRQRPAR
ncbi:MAG: hypothetical protein AAF411_27880, partial [Myxococcota bacterium]